mmetsp:Transcript_68104/g.188687  ORF Transcript_68104/g.188687 Transcript_68104/m.188687 type:complete len:228 (-) Transcript_68104:378-1061(-)
MLLAKERAAGTRCTRSRLPPRVPYLQLTHDEPAPGPPQMHAEATLEEEVSIKVPPGVVPGQKLKCNVNGQMVTVKVPPNAGPGSVLKLRVPSQKPKPQVSMRTAGAAVMAAGAVQQVGGPGAGAPRMMAAGATQIGGPGAGAPRMMAAGGGQQIGGPGAGAPQTMAVGAGVVQQIPPPQPTKTKMQITVPQGVRPGAPLQIQLPDGRTARIQVPPGVQPGATLTIQV